MNYQVILLKLLKEIEKGFFNSEELLYCDWNKIKDKYYKLLKIKIK